MKSAIATIVVFLLFAVTSPSSAGVQGLSSEPSGTHFVAGSKWLGTIPKNIPFDDLKFSKNGGAFAYRVTPLPDKQAWVINGRQLQSYDLIEDIWIGGNGNFAFAGKTGDRWYINHNGLQSLAFYDVGGLDMRPDGSRYYFYGCQLGLSRQKRCELYRNGEPTGMAFPDIALLTLSTDDEHVLMEVRESPQADAPLVFIADGTRIPLPAGITLGQAGIDNYGVPFYVANQAKGQALVRLRGKSLGPYDKIEAIYTQTPRDRYFHAVKNGQSVLVYDGTEYPVTCFGSFEAARFGKVFLHLCRLANGQLEILANGKLRNADSRFAFLHGTDLYENRTDGTNEYLVKNGDVIRISTGNIFGAALSPDGKRLALAMKSHEGANYVEVDGEAQRSFAEGTGYPEFTPDGKQAIYVGFENGKQYLVKDGKPSGTGWDQIVGITPTAFNDGKYFSAFVYSPDGQSVGYYARRGDILWWVVERLD